MYAPYERKVIGRIQHHRPARFLRGRTYSDTPF